MDVAALVENYGYPVILLGSLLEGESVLLAGGFAAHRGYLVLPGVIAVGALGGFLGDQILFHLGRRHGSHIVFRFPKVARQSQKMNKWLLRHQNFSIILVRFVYGMRLAGPVLLGMSGISPFRFFFLNLTGAIIWATLVSFLGYGSGVVLNALLSDIGKYEEITILVILFSSLIFSIVYRHRLNKHQVVLRREAGIADKIKSQ